MSSLPGVGVSNSNGFPAPGRLPNSPRSIASTIRRSAQPPIQPSINFCFALTSETTALRPFTACPGVNPARRA